MPCQIAPSKFVTRLNKHSKFSFSFIEISISCDAISRIKKYYALHSDHFIVGNAKFCFAPGDKFSPTGSIRMRGCRKIPKEREAIFFR